MTELSHYIDGRRVPGKSGRFAEVFNPATGEVQATVPLASRPSSTPRSPPPRPPSRNGPRPIPSAAPG
jgi:hypothetical protein